jgi:hypothetical protein
MTSTAPAARWPVPLDDPYPGLRQLRDSGPVHWLPQFGAHLVVSHARRQRSCTVPADPQTPH